MSVPLISNFALRQPTEPLESPTACAICARDPGQGPMLDTMRNIEFYGRVYICVGSEESPGCMMQLARLAGWADPAMRTMLEEELGRLSVEVMELRNSDLRTAVREELTSVLSETRARARKREDK